ncbi:uncharacterized protein METZ01_LOCUS296888, partial [marine metagenome]
VDWRRLAQGADAGKDAWKSGVRHARLTRFTSGGFTMQNCVGATFTRLTRLSLITSLAGAMSITIPVSVSAQRATGAERPDDRNTSRVLGNMELTAADNVVKGVVDRLDFESYKALIKGLTEFGDREQGT